MSVLHSHFDSYLQKSQFLRKYVHFRKLVIRIKMMPSGSHQTPHASMHKPCTELGYSTEREHRTSTRTFIAFVGKKENMGLAIPIEMKLVKCSAGTTGTETS